MQIKQTSYCTFKLEFKNGTAIINPIKKGEGDISVYSLPESPYLNFEVDASLKVKTAGEYESHDIFVTSIKNKNLDSFVFNVSSEDLTIGVIGFVNEIPAIPEDLFETTDVLLIGAGSGMFLSPKDAAQLIDTLSPQIAIVFGFKEQAGKDLANTLDSIEEAKKEIPGLLLSEKSLKLDYDYVNGIDNTVIYYFEI